MTTVMKFGGTSVQDGNAILRVTGIVKQRLESRPLVVVSAMSEVTRTLSRLAEEAEIGRTDRVRDGLQALRDRHFNVAETLLTGKISAEARARMETLFHNLETFLDGIGLIRELSDRSRAGILSYGELLSSVLVAAAMNENGIRCHWTDARKLIFTDDRYLGAKPDMELSAAAIRRILPAEAEGADVVVTQGFIASTLSGQASVLGFEGSDYSAALFAMALGAEKLEIWTDVDGIRTADPRIVEETLKISVLSYEEAAKLAFLGARVLHPLTVAPAKSRDIPIHVLNSLHPEEEGSVVVRGDLAADGPKSIAFRTDIDYVEVHAGGMTAAVAAVFGVLEKYGLETLLLSVSDSGLSFTLTSGQSGAEEAYEALRGSFDTHVFRDKGQVSVIGKNVTEQPELLDNIRAVAGRVFLYAMGSDLMDMSVVIGRDEVCSVVDSLHTVLFG